MFKKIIPILGISALLLSGSISTEASGLVKTDFRRVTAKNGLVLRDQNCNKIKTLSNGSHIYMNNIDMQQAIDLGSSSLPVNSPKTKVCKVGKKKLKLVLTKESDMGGAVGYTSTQYLAPIYAAKNLGDGDIYAAKNLRVKNFGCGKGISVPKDTNMTAKYEKGGHGWVVSCKQNGKWVMMVQVFDYFMFPNEIYKK